MLAAGTNCLKGNTGRFYSGYCGTSGLYRTLVIGRAREITPFFHHGGTTIIPYILVNIRFPFFSFALCLISRTHDGLMAAVQICEETSETFLWREIKTTDLVPALVRLLADVCRKKNYASFQQADACCQHGDINRA